MQARRVERRAVIPQALAVVRRDGDEGSGSVDSRGNRADKLIDLSKCPVVARKLR